MARQRNPEVIRARAARAYEAACNIATRLDGFSVRNHLESVQLHFAGYAERGYSDPYHGIIATGNWNAVDKYDSATKKRVAVPGDDLPVRLSAVFEALGVDCEWSDEWSTCNDCGKLVRTEPDSHGWKPSYKPYVEGDAALYCLACAEEESDLRVNIGGAKAV